MRWSHGTDASGSLPLPTPNPSPSKGTYSFVYSESGVVNGEPVLFQLHTPMTATATSAAAVRVPTSRRSSSGDAPARRRTTSNTTATESARAAAVSGRVMPHSASAADAIARSRARFDAAHRETPHHAASHARLDGTSERYIAWKYWTGNDVTQISHA